MYYGQLENRELLSPILQHYHISERFQRATKHGKFWRAAWEFDVVLNSGQ